MTLDKSIADGVESVLECVSRATFLAQPDDIPNFLTSHVKRLVELDDQSGDVKKAALKYQEQWEKRFLKVKRRRQLQQSIRESSLASTSTALCPSPLSFNVVPSNDGSLTVSSVCVLDPYQNLKLTLEDESLPRPCRRFQDSTWVPNNAGKKVKFESIRPLLPPIPRKCLSPLQLQGTNINFVARQTKDLSYRLVLPALPMKAGSSEQKNQDSALSDIETKLSTMWDSLGLTTTSQRALLEMGKNPEGPSLTAAEQPPSSGTLDSSVWQGARTETLQSACQNSTKEHPTEDTLALPSDNILAFVADEATAGPHLLNDESTTVEYLQEQMNSQTTLKESSLNVQLDKQELTRGHYKTKLKSTAPSSKTTLPSSSQKAGPTTTTPKQVKPRAHHCYLRDCGIHSKNPRLNLTLGIVNTCRGQKLNRLVPLMEEGHFRLQVPYRPKNGYHYDPEFDRRNVRVYNRPIYR
ncbi:uncharacterized protein ACB058_011824 [Synchiropus picturatus]